MLIVANRGIADNSKWKGFQSFSRCKLFMESPGFKLNRNKQGQDDGVFFLLGPTIQVLVTWRFINVKLEIFMNPN